MRDDTRSPYKPESEGMKGPAPSSAPDCPVLAALPGAGLQDTWWGLAHPTTASEVRPPQPTPPPGFPTGENRNITGNLEELSPSGFTAHY